MEFTSHHSFPPCGLLGELIRLWYLHQSMLFSGPYPLTLRRPTEVQERT
uniref:Uncharacterized protein n=1 Tax=Picea glauca TaxID=3330 RepID=A0A101LZY4_PICGL|nr:hypothetical protein ABT39_MTgene4491 [Picea glauca]